MNATDRFASAIAHPGGGVALDEACLAIAAHARPDLNVGAELRRLDRLAEAVPRQTFGGIMHHLFVVEGLRGNQEDYHDPRNSFLPDVLDRRLGIPISLSILAMEVGRRLGVGIRGIGMPGHFLVADAEDPGTFSDPFNGGRLLDEAGCRRLFERVTGSPAGWSPAALAPTPSREIVARVLRNLGAEYRRRRDLAALTWVLRLRTMLDGDRPGRELAPLAAPLN
jgi:regulator of sirC expression with transglutaminase-like and TPR domain